MFTKFIWGRALSCLSACIFATSAAAGTAGWSVSVSTDPMTDKRRGVAFVDSIELGGVTRANVPISFAMATAPARMRSSDRYSLVVKCDYASPQVYVELMFPRGINMSASTISHRFGRGEILNVVWTEGQNGSVFIQDQRSVAEFVRAASEASLIAFMIDPLENGYDSFNTSFRGSGSAAAISQVYRSCGQDLPT